MGAPSPSASAFGYHTTVVQRQFQARDESGPAQFVLPYLDAGMSVLDCGCGPGTVTQGLARRAAPAMTVGCDLEPGMIEHATALAAREQLANLSFRTADIMALPFADDHFDLVFSAAVTEHLAEPLAAVRELARVCRPGGLVAITRTDWSGPLIAPDAEAMTRFFELLEAGFRTQGGTMNGGRHLRAMTRAAGLEDVEFFASYINGTDDASLRSLIGDYTGWVQSMPIFSTLVGEGVTSEAELARLVDDMWAWAEHPDAYLGVTVCRIVTRKPPTQKGGE